MAKGDYLDRKRQEQQTWLDIGEEMGMQKMWDYVQIALIDPEVMSTHKLTKARLEKVYKKLAEIAEHYKIAFSDHVEADHRQEELDSVLREVWQEDFFTFYQRYPYVKQFDYKKGKKAWK
jgi:hypothetical protein